MTSTAEASSVPARAGTTDPVVAPFGSWPSPLGTDALTARTVHLSEPALDAHAAWWIESRPELGGRCVLVRCPHDGEPRDVELTLPGGEPADVRTRVHEYGGASYAVAAGVGVVVDVTDSALYRFDVPADGSHPEPQRLVPLTAPGGARHGAPVLDLARGLVHAVREDHDRPGPDGHAVAELVSVPLDGSRSAAVLLDGRDFVAAPALSADGARLACVAWDHPVMPWTSSELHVLDLDESGAPTGRVHVAGGGGVAVANPTWGTDGDLFFLDDSSGWMNPYRVEGASLGAEPRLRALHRGPTEFGLPQWGLGPRTMATVGGDFLVALATEDGHRTLVALRRDNGQAEEWAGDFEPVGGLAAGDGRVVVLGASATRGAAVLRLDLGRATVRVLREGAPALLDDAAISRPEALTWDSPQPDGTTATAHGFWYAPAHPSATGPAGELPPAIVRVHGGPTASVSPTYATDTQFWTSRGIGVLDVDYGGSTGYGRAYQDRLEGQWGVVDAADCTSGARFLADTGRADGARLAISGASAGGFTVLSCLTGSDVFSAGISIFGVLDLEALVRETHKFEARYPDSLIAPHPERADVYAERTPLNRLGELSSPVLVLQGSDDVVAPAQAHALADALRAKGLPVALVEYDGEGHGFRRAETIRAAAAAQLSFLAQVWGFEPAGDVENLAIENL